MNIILHRTEISHEYTQGQLYIDRKVVCDTLENSDSCLPAGVYDISIVKCRQYGRNMICIGKSPCTDCPLYGEVFGNTPLPVFCPQIKPGNGVHNRHDGRIIIGYSLVPCCILTPKELYGILYNRIRVAASRGKVKLVVQRPGESVRRASFDV